MQGGEAVVPTIGGFRLDALVTFPDQVPQQSSRLVAILRPSLGGGVQRLGDFGCLGHCVARLHGRHTASVTPDLSVTPMMMLLGLLARATRIERSLNGHNCPQVSGSYAPCQNTIADWGSVSDR